MARFVLIHGAWHGSWCFAELADALSVLGHEVDAPDLPCDQVGLTVPDYARLVGPQLDAVVVGHSFGAQVAALVAARRHVFLAGLLPVADPRSECFVPEFGGLVRDELGRSYWPDPDTCAEKMYPDCTREQSDWAFPLLRPQAPVDTIEPCLSTDDVVIATTRDRCIDGAWQLRTGQAYGARVVELDAGHSPFFTQPEELAHLLDAFA